MAIVGFSMASGCSGAALFCITSRYPSDKSMGMCLIIAKYALDLVANGRDWVNSDDGLYQQLRARTLDFVLFTTRLFFCRIPAILSISVPERLLLILWRALFHPVCAYCSLKDDGDRVSDVCIECKREPRSARKSVFGFVEPGLWLGRLN
ncbi:hypothetical protein D3C72_1860920 [compost metagenome]